MRVSSDYFTNNFINNVNNLAQQQNKLQTQATTGLKVTLPEDNPSVMSQVLNLQTASDQNNQYQSNITALQNSATTSYTAMTTLKSLSDQASQFAIEASNGQTSTKQLADYAQGVQQLIQQAVQLGNTRDAQGNYVFGGTITNSPPFTTTTDANNNVTAVAYSGNDSVSSAEIAPGVTVSAQTPGANTTGSGPGGLFTDSSSGADFFNHLLSLEQNITSGNKTAITATDIPALAQDGDNIVSQIGTNSVLQATLTTANNTVSSQSINLTTQISNATNADLATTLTQLQQTQTAYQAALASASQVMNLSLLNYLQ